MVIAICVSSTMHVPVVFPRRSRLLLPITVFVIGTSAFGPYNRHQHSFASQQRQFSNPQRLCDYLLYNYYCSFTSTSSQWHRRRIGESCCCYSGATPWTLFPADTQSTIIRVSSDNDEQKLSILLALSVIAFASSHIGMSAVRASIISFFRELAQAMKWINNEEWILPKWWPGDNTGGNQLFPDAWTAGRQMYRAIYTMVSFTTLGAAFVAYLDAASIQQPAEAIVGTPSYMAYLFSAALSYGAVTASLFNASPLGLMPGFKVKDQSNNNGSIGNSIANIRRDDTLKFTTRGLTRITRHPLILPVVPWGLANAVLAGARPCDYIIFGGLSIYAVAGCFAQDLRVMREEGSVGTVFRIDAREEQNEEEEREERERLRSFFEATSFIPFQAVFDGRQNFDDIIMEVPWLQFVAGTVAGVLIEEWFLHLLKDLTDAVLDT